MQLKHMNSSRHISLCNEKKCTISDSNIQQQFNISSISSFESISTIIILVVSSKQLFLRKDIDLRPYWMLPQHAAAAPELKHV